MEVESTKGLTLSGEYRHNDEENGVERLDFAPRRYDYVGESYSLMHHDIYEDAEDSIMANHSKLDLTGKKGMSGMAVGGTVDQADIVIYTMLKAHNGKYLRVMDSLDGKKRIFAVGEEGVEYDSSYMFKIFKRKGYFEIMNGDLYMSIDPEDMDVCFSPLPAVDKHDFFKFGITRYKYTEDDRKRLLIYSMMNQPWGFEFEHPIDPISGSEVFCTREFGKEYSYSMVEQTPDEGPHQDWIKYSGVKRFISPYDGKILKKLYRDDTKNKVKGIGVLWKNKREGLPGPDYPDRGHPTNNKTYKNASNNYILLMSNGSMADEDAILMGYDGKIRWVQYHNEFYDKFFNQTLTPKDIVDEVKPNFLIDLPYETEIVNESGRLEWLMKAKAQKLDLTQTKNSVTPNLEYARKDDTKNGN